MAADDRPATVENVLHAWEASGALLGRTLLAFSAVWMANSTPELDALHEESSPKLAQHSDAIWLDRALYERFLALQARAETGEVTLDAEDAYLLSETLASFTRAGVALDGGRSKQLRALNTDLAELGTQFQRVNREARVAGAVVVTDVAELDGLSEEEIAAIDAGDGTWRIELVNTSQQPLMAKLHHRGLRQHRLYEASITRGLGGEHDARGIIAAIARARSQKATLLGYENFAALRIASGCAKTTDAVNALMGPLGRAARAQADADATTLAARFATLEPGAEFARGIGSTSPRWSARNSSVSMRPNWPTPRRAPRPGSGLRGRPDLYGITFRPRPDLVGHTPDADVYEVRDADGSPIGLFCMDFWARPTKQGGAWMTSLVNETTVFKSLPVVTNNCNYTPATTASPRGMASTMNTSSGTPCTDCSPPRSTVAVGHVDAARLRRVPLPGQRVLGNGARPGAAREPARQAGGGVLIQSGLRNPGDHGGDAARPGVAPDTTGRVAHQRGGGRSVRAARRSPHGVLIPPSSRRATARPTSTTFGARATRPATTATPGRR